MLKKIEGYYKMKMKEGRKWKIKRKLKISDNY